MKLFYKVLAFLSVFALIVGLPSRDQNGKIQRAEAGEITNLAASVSSATKSGSATYTISFKNATKIPKDGGRINLRVFGAKWDTNFNSATIATGTTPSSISIYSRSYDSIVLSTSQDIAADTNITVKLDNVVNPSASGYYFVHLWTTQYSNALDGTSNWGGDYKSSYYQIGSNANVTGTIIDSNGAAMPFTQVYINTTDYSKYHSTYADKDGKYGFGDIAAGSYRFTVYNSWNYGTGIIYGAPADSTITVESTGTVTKNATFAAPTKTITGTVTKDTASGAAVTDANVSVYKSGGSGWGDVKTDSSGKFTFKVPGGTWNFSVYPRTYPADWVYNNSGNNSDQVIFADNTTSESKTKDFIVKSLSATIKGTIKKPDTSVVPKYGASVNFTSSDKYYFYASLDGNEGKFSTKVVPGTYSVSGWSSDSSFSFPKIANFSVAENSTYDMGTITLSEKSDTISGTIKDQNGAAVGGVSVSAWKNQDGYDYANTTTKSDGTYTMKVTPGTWQVSAYPPWKQDGSDYVYTGKPETITVKSGVVSTVNFTFQKVTSKIEVLVTDPDGNTLTSQNGWLSAGDGSQDWGNIGSSLTNGKGTLKTPKGKWTVTAYLYGSDFGNPENKIVTIGDNETTSITMPASRKDATIKGTVYDENGDKVTGKYMSVYASKGSGASWQSATFDTTQGTYEMKVEAGTWKVGWWIDHNLGYSSNNENTEVKVASKDVAIFDIKLKKANATIKGKTTDPNGTPLKWMWVTADTRNSDEKTTSFDKYYNNGGSSNENGDYSIKVPAGTYYVGGNTWYGSGYINPKRNKVTVEKDKEVTVDLVFRTADAKISGTVTKDGSGANAYVSASSEDGGVADANTTNEGKYEFNISSGTKWQVVATQQVDKKIYKSERKTVDLTSAKTGTADLELKEQKLTLPDKLTSSFRASDASSIELDDGTKVTIPAGSLLTTSDTVNANVEPTIQLPEQTDAKPVGYGYDITFTKESDQTSVTDFANPITLEVKYTDQALTDAKITEEKELHLAYYDTSKSDWVELNTCTTNELNNTVTCTVDHTTKFALVAAADTKAPSAPTSVKATAGDAKASLSWTNPTDADFASVNIYRSTTSGTLGDKVHSAVTGTSKDDTSLTNDTTYYYTFKALDSTGNESVASTQVSAKPSATAPVSSDGTTASSTSSSSSTTTLPKTGLPAQTGLPGQHAENYASIAVILLSIGGLTLIGRRYATK